MRVTNIHFVRLRLTRNVMSHTCLYFPALERNRTLAGTHFLSGWVEEAELTWVTAG